MSADLVARMRAVVAYLNGGAMPDSPAGAGGRPEPHRTIEKRWKTLGYTVPGREKVLALPSEVEHVAAAYGITLEELRALNDGWLGNPGSQLGHHPRWYVVPASSWLARDSG